MSLPEIAPLRVGMKCQRRDGRVVEIQIFDDDPHARFPYYAGDGFGEGCWYSSSGESITGFRPLDLVGVAPTSPAVERVIANAEIRLNSLLPADSQARKNTPVYSGVMAYFPRALAYIATVSKAGNDKHNPGQPLHWSKDKSNDHADCVARHLLEHGTVDADDGLKHSGKLAWRALALLEIELENEAKAAKTSSAA